jgi:tetratricopeptide (TPR) repeat protein
LEHVKSFALGQRGSDQLRIHAANLAVKHQLLPAGALSMWTQGAWHEILLIQTEISGEPTEWNVPAKAKRLAEKAHHELRAGKTQSAERLINEALKLAPGDPRLLHSLAQAYKLQGRNTEYQQLWRQVHEQYPDYFFGIIDAAMAHLENHELDQAQTLLTNLLQRRKLHISEMAALCLAQIELALKQGKRELARSSLRILEQVYPEHPSLEALRARVEPPDFSQLFRKPLGWR